jgi:hypothetical protein
MSRIVFEENTTIWFVASISNVNSPTAAEINAGVNLTSWCPKDGLKFGVTNNKVPIGAIDTAFDAEIQGSWGAELTFDFFRDDSADTAYTTLPRKTNGYFVIRPWGAAPTAVAAAADKVSVWPVQTGQRIPNDSAANENQRFTCECAVTSTPNLGTTVA